MLKRNNHERFIKYLLCVVLVILIINIYFLSVIFNNDSAGYFVKKPSDLHQDAISKSGSKQPRKQQQPSRKNEQNTKKAMFVPTNTTQLATQKILWRLAHLETHYSKRFFSPKSKKHFDMLLSSLKSSPLPLTGDTLTDYLKLVNGRELFPETGLNFGQVLNTLCSSKIVYADNTHKGTQLKILVTLEGGEKSVFKPQWYKRDEVISGEVFAGKDRHNGEVAAFHLSTLLGLRRVPLTVGRKINLHREVLPVAAPELAQTFYQEGNNTCFYGVCFYCNSQDPVCAKQDIMEGALILWLPDHFALKKFRHPWQRTYKKDISARWEMDASYCQLIRKDSLYSRGPRLLDLIDAAIFDFLIDNGDRHHYEVISNFNNSAVLLIDNGKSFGNPNIDHIDILAPLYQCCRIRESLWNRLLWLRGKVLSKMMRQLLEWSHIAPVITEPHLEALDRRIEILIATVYVCFDERNGQKNVIVTD